MPFQSDLDIWLIDDGTVSAKQAGSEYWYAQASPDKTDDHGYPMSKHVVARAYYHRLNDDVQALPAWASDWMIKNAR